MSVQPIPPAAGEVSADRILAGGGLSGAQLDDVWARLAPDLKAAGRAAEDKGRGWITSALAAFGGLAATAAFLLVAQPADAPLGADAPQRFSVRGSAGAVVIESTCGARDEPCVIGEPVYLRLRTMGDALTVHVDLEGAHGTTRLLEAQRFEGGAVIPLQVRVRPEVEDAAAPLQVVAHALRDDGSAVSGTLTLEVAP